MNEIDIHGLSERDAIREIERYIVSLPDTVKTFRIVHGYHNGDKLKEMVRHPRKIKSKRIKRRKYTMNQGETIIELY